MQSGRLSTSEVFDELRDPPISVRIVNLSKMIIDRGERRRALMLCYIGSYGNVNLFINLILFNFNNTLLLLFNI